MTTVLEKPGTSHDAGLRVLGVEAHVSLYPLVTMEITPGRSPTWLLG